MARAEPTLEELNDGRYAKEPTKRKRAAGGGFEIVPDWSFGSRHLLAHIIFNVLGYKVPKNTPKGKLPSLDKTAMDKLGVPIGMRISDLRSFKRSVDSFKNAISFCQSFRKNGPIRAPFLFNSLGYDNIERIFSESERSIPLNLDKAARKAFVTPVADPVDLDTLPLATQKLLQAIG